MWVGSAAAVVILAGCGGGSSGESTVTVTAGSESSSGNSSSSISSRPKPTSDAEYEAYCSDSSVPKADRDEVCYGSNDPASAGAQGEPPANPVPLAKKIPGCDTGTAKAGETDFDGNRYVTCEPPGIQEAEVRTYPSDPEELYDPLTPDDSTWFIKGDNWVATFWYPQPGEDEMTTADVKSIAADMGGKAIVP